MAVSVEKKATGGQPLGRVQPTAFFFLVLSLLCHAATAYWAVGRKPHISVPLVIGGRGTDILFFSPSGLIGWLDLFEGHGTESNELQRLRETPTG
jgi:hypothetical protein